MKKVIFGIFCSTLFSFHVFAQEETNAGSNGQAKTGSETPLTDDGLKFKCSNGAHIRWIEVTDGGAQFACTVDYTKETEEAGAKSSLWTANSDVNFCKEKAQYLADKLSGLGWTCSAQ